MNNTHFISTSASFKSESPYVVDALISMFLGFLVGITGVTVDFPTMSGA